MKTRTIIFDMPENWRMAGDCCPFNCNNNCASTKCPLANAKEAIQVKFDIDKETGLSVIDANGRFHFEAQDKYYAVAVDKKGE